MNEYADGDDYTYERVQYAQVGQAHSLSDELRKLQAEHDALLAAAVTNAQEMLQLREQLEMQRNMKIYWHNSYNALAYAVALVMGLYGWGGNFGYIDGLAHVRKDIEALRARVRELMGR